jgi:hypothetical protein
MFGLLASETGLRDVILNQRVIVKAKLWQPTCALPNLQQECLEAPSDMQRTRERIGRNAQE